MWQKDNKEEGTRYDGKEQWGYHEDDLWRVCTL